MVHVEGIDDCMIANNLEPHYLTHPGEVIKDELEARGISQRQLARSIGVPASQLNLLLSSAKIVQIEQKTKLICIYLFSMQKITSQSIRHFCLYSVSVQRALCESCECST